MNIDSMSDQDLKTYKMIKERINTLEKKIEFYESEIPHRLVREKLQATRLTLQANCEMLKFLFGEGNLRQ